MSVFGVLVIRIVILTWRTLIFQSISMTRRLNVTRSLYFYSLEIYIMVCRFMSRLSFLFWPYCHNQSLEITITLSWNVTYCNTATNRWSNKQLCHPIRSSGKIPVAVLVRANSGARAVVHRWYHSAGADLWAHSCKRNSFDFEIITFMSKLI